MFCGEFQDTILRDRGKSYQSYRVSIDATSLLYVQEQLHLDAKFQCYTILSVIYALGTVTVNQSIDPRTQLLQFKCTQLSTSHGSSVTLTVIFVVPTSAPVLPVRRLSEMSSHETADTLYHAVDFRRLLLHIAALPLQTEHLVLDVATFLRQTIVTSL